MNVRPLRYRPAVGTASGRRSGWIKHVASVDPAGRNGYAVQGDFLPDGRLIEVPAGAVLLEVSPQGSVKHDWQRARVYRVEDAGDGTARRVELTPADEKIDWRRDFLRARDVLIKALSPAEEDEGKAEQESGFWFSGDNSAVVNPDRSLTVTTSFGSVTIPADAFRLLAQAVR